MRVQYDINGEQLQNKNRLAIWFCPRYEWFCGRKRTHFYLKSGEQQVFKYTDRFITALEGLRRLEKLRGVGPLFIYNSS